MAGYAVGTRNDLGHEIKVGMTVDRLDKFNGRERGKVIVYNPDRTGEKFLVRWPTFDEWCRADLLYQRLGDSK